MLEDMSACTDCITGSSDRSFPREIFAARGSVRLGREIMHLSAHGGYVPVCVRAGTMYCVRSTEYELAEMLGRGLQQASGSVLHVDLTMRPALKMSWTAMSGVIFDR